MGERRGKRAEEGENGQRRGKESIDGSDTRASATLGPSLYMAISRLFSAPAILGGTCGSHPQRRASFQKIRTHQNASLHAMSSIM